MTTSVAMVMVLVVSVVLVTMLVAAVVTRHTLWSMFQVIVRSFPKLY